MTVSNEWVVATIILAGGLHLNFRQTLGQLDLVMYRAQVFRLKPTAAQAAYFARAAGAARHAYNWGLALRQRYYRRFKKTPPLARLKRQWNKHKRGKKMWATEVGKVVTASALNTLEEAYTRYFLGLARRPRFKKKGRARTSFCVADEGRGVLFDGCSVRLPVVGRVRFRGERRWPAASIKTAHVFQQGDRWFASVMFKLLDPKPEPHAGPTCGIDLGSKMFATVASGGEVKEEVQSPKPYAKAKRRLKRLQRRMDRRKKVGKNRGKAKRAVQVLHWRIANSRSDFLHKLSRQVVNTYGLVTLEDLHVAAMTKGLNRKTVGDLGWGEFRRQVEYKAIETGTRVVIADRFFPSTKMCSCCGFVNPAVVLGVEEWDCPQCHAHHLRDHNAAFNLEKLGRGSPEVTPAEIGDQGRRKPTRCRSKKQECT